ncbi:hypothetical protein EVAR_35377_1 [Eumeta japonica]|uniref:Uncharacterized protein n=1 Tax=Eumeta variegata TaxID=151549 RepID=A0A4C1XCM3_EUMVA|nr:hypothetical protein EVAR_35377_1 [Eumeta japonica]
MVVYESLFTKRQFSIATVATCPVLLKKEAIIRIERGTSLARHFDLAHRGEILTKTHYRSMFRETELQLITTPILDDVTEENNRCAGDVFQRGKRVRFISCGARRTRHRRSIKFSPNSQ